MMHLSDGESHCTIPDAKGGVVTSNLVEIGDDGALLATTADFEPNAYLDLTLALKGQPRRNFFASVVSCGDLGLRVAWMHIDPGEQKRLKELLVAYRAMLKASAVPKSTRRVVKPSGMSDSAEFTPFGAEAAAAAGATSEESGERKGTRRVLKPKTKAAPEAEATPEAVDERDPLDDSRAHAVVLAPTDRFAKLHDVAQSVAREPTVPAVASTAPAVPAAPSDGMPSPAPVPATKPMGRAPFPDPDGAVLPASDGKRVVVGSDGRMDIGASIRSRAKTVNASELAARHDRVRVLNMATIKALIQEAVEEAANHLTRALGEAEKKRLLEEAEESFKERLKAFQEEKLSAEVRQKQLQEQFEAAQRLLEDERKRAVSADQFTVSAKGMEDIEAVFRRLIERSVADGKLDPGLEEQLRKVAAHVLDSERERMREKELGAQSDKIELLEKKLRRLATNLEETERQRDEAREIAAHLEQFAGQGLSIDQIKQKYKAGLKGDDPNRERKLALMKELVEQNRDLRKALGIATNPVEPNLDPPALVVAEERAADSGEKSETETADSAPADPSDEDAGAPLENPDDMMWEPGMEIQPKEEPVVRAVRSITNFKDFAPPPLESK